MANSENRKIGVGDDVVIRRLEDPQQDLMFRDYIGRVMEVKGEHAFVDSDACGLFQSVSFKRWFPVEKLYLVTPEQTKYDGGKCD